jgi:hypothetical protein
VGEHRIDELLGHVARPDGVLDRERELVVTEKIDLSSDAARRHRDRPAVHRVQMIAGGIDGLIGVESAEDRVAKRHRV